MAIYKIFAVNDATMYSEYPLMNTGLDAMNESRNWKNPLVDLSNPVYHPNLWGDVGETWVSSSITYNTESLEGYTTSAVSRFLIKFDQDDINYVFDNIVKDDPYDVHLKSYVATAQGIAQQSKLEVFPIAYDWDNGTGHYGNKPEVTDGVTWKQRNNNFSNNLWPSSSLPDYQHYESIDAAPGGGVWYTGSTNPNIDLSSASQSYDVRTKKDLDVKVTDIVDVWYSQSKGINPYTTIENNGFIVKWTGSLEFEPSSSIVPQIKFYSSDTYTIYPPELCVKWDDSDFTTGSLTVIDDTDIYMALDENPGVFYEDSINRFRVNCRPKYPVRTFQTASSYTQNYLLPSSSYYAIKDLDTNEYVVDFDENYTKISADPQSSYFTVYMNGLEPERQYQILIKTFVGNEIIVYKDNNFNFKVQNG